MPKTVLQRLRKIDLKIAERVDRKRIGSLIGRLYFQPQEATTWTEVPLVNFQDSGITPSSLLTGQEVTAHRYVANVGRDWYDANRDVIGRYAVKPTGKEAEPLPVDLEGHTADDSQTFAVLEFVRSYEVETF